MGKVKSAYMSATMDDMQATSEQEQEYAERIADELREDGISPGEIPAEVYRQAGLAGYTTAELSEEVTRRVSEYER